MKTTIIIKNIITSSLAALVFMVALTLLVPLVKDYEEKHYPIVSEAILTKSHLKDGEVHLYLTFTKLRDCEFVHLDAIQLGVRVGYIFGEDGDYLPVSRDEGQQSIGPIVLNTNTIKHLKITTVHRCNLLYDTRSKLYEHGDTI